jgi:hypothetical protein
MCWSYYLISVNVVIKFVHTSRAFINYWYNVIFSDDNEQIN